MANSYDLTLIIPAYNEERLIGETLDKAIGYLKKRKYTWEIILVNDGSTDGTVSIVEKFKRKGVKLVNLKENSGKGAALRAGMLKAKGDNVIYADADLSVGLNYIDKFMKILQKGSDVVIGSRRVEGSQIKVHQPVIRETLGRGYTLLTKFVTWTNIADFTCGFKGFSNEAAKKIFKNSLVDRWAYDSEILFLANKFGYKTTQVPVKWVNRQDSRVQLSNVILESFRDLLSVRVNDLTGRYNK